MFSTRFFTKEQLTYLHGLLATFGFTADAIVQITEASRRRVDRDLRHFGGRKALFCGRGDDIGIFPRIFLAYAQATFDLLPEPWSTLHSDTLHSFMEELVRKSNFAVEPPIKEIARDLYSHACRLTFPGCQPWETGHVTIADEICGSEVVFKAKAHEKILIKYLRAVAEHRLPEPFGMSDFKSILVGRIHEQLRPHFAPTWRREANAFIDDALCTLTPEDEEYLRIFFIYRNEAETYPLRQPDRENAIFDQLRAIPGLIERLRPYVMRMNELHDRVLATTNPAP